MKAALPTHRCNLVTSTQHVDFYFHLRNQSSHSSERLSTTSSLSEDDTFSFSSSRNPLSFQPRSSKKSHPFRHPNQNFVCISWPSNPFLLDVLKLTISKTTNFESHYSVFSTLLLHFLCMKKVQSSASFLKHFSLHYFFE